MPYLRLLGAQFALGAAAIFARFALLGAGPLAVSALRLGIAALIALAFALPFRRISPRREVAFACAGGLLAVHFAAWIASLAYTSVAVSTLLVTTTPLWTQAYEAARERRAPERAFILALVLAAVGVALIVFARSSIPAPVAGHTLLGDALALAGSLAIGAYLIVVRDAGIRHSRPLSTRQIVVRTYGWSAAALSLAALCVRQPLPAANALAAWSGILAMALVSQLLGHTALNAALRDFSPSTIALTTLLEPMLAAAFAAFIFGEVLSAPVVGGGALVIAAVAVTLVTEGRRARSRSITSVAGV